MSFVILAIPPIFASPFSASAAFDLLETSQSAAFAMVDRLRPLAELFQRQAHVE